MDQQKRLLLAIALSFGLTLLYTTFVAKPPEVVAGLPDGGAPTQVAEVPDAGPAEVPQVVAAPPAPETDGGVAEQPSLEKKLTDLERPEMKLVFSTEGAGLESALLTGTKEREQQEVSLAEGYRMLVGAKKAPPPQMNMVVPVQGRPLPFAASVEGAAPLPGTLRYELVESGPDKVVYRARHGTWEVDKTFHFEPRPYELKVEVGLKNVGSAPAQGELHLHNGRAIDLAKEEAPSFFGGIGNQASLICQAGDQHERKLPDAEQPKVETKGPISFGAIDNQYFLSALYPAGGQKEGRCLVSAAPTARTVDLAFPLDVPVGERVSFTFGGFLGPKDLETLQRVGSAAPAGAPQVQAQGPGLERSVDFGWWAFICRVLLSVMKFFFGLTGNWGVAIILLTVLVKVVLLPLTHKAMVSAENMKKLQPKLEALRKKYADDREKQNMEMMKLYQEEKVNPLGGCLPLLLQLPIWAALFTTLRTSYELYGEPFFGPVWTDLTFKDPTYLLPLALGVTMIITQKLQPQVMDPVQAKMFTYFMPVFFTAIMLNYPAGLSLYIFTNNVLSIGQQFALRKYLEKKGIAAPPPQDPKKEGKKQARA